MNDLKLQFYHDCQLISTYPLLLVCSAYWLGNTGIPRRDIRELPAEKLAVSDFNSESVQTLRFLVFPTQIKPVYHCNDANERFVRHNTRLKKRSTEKGESLCFCAEEG